MTWPLHLSLSYIARIGQDGTHLPFEPVSRVTPLFPKFTPMIGDCVRAAPEHARIFNMLLTRQCPKVTHMRRTDFRRSV